MMDAPAQSSPCFYEQIFRWHGAKHEHIQAAKASEEHFVHRGERDAGLQRGALRTKGGDFKHLLRSPAHDVYKEISHAIQLSRDPQAISDVDEKEQANSDGDKHTSDQAFREGCDSARFYIGTVAKIPSLLVENKEKGQQRASPSKTMVVDICILGLHPATARLEVQMSN